ncbi:MAG TPA: OB-fold domain-containing protein [Deltaproteobacteria bacterium]|nr:OB-fold domain-containing protein [Deltaproteobacteria bacterium]
MPYDKPLPKINPDNRPFWEGCRGHELRFQKCSDCGHVRWPPSPLCPCCHSTGITWLVSRGMGRVYTFAVYHTAYHPGFAADLPYTVAVVALDEGPHLLTTIVGCKPDEVRCDMPVEVLWEDVDETISLPRFKPFPDDKEHDEP